VTAARKKLTTATRMLLCDQAPEPASQPEPHQKCGTGRRTEVSAGRGLNGATINRELHPEKISPKDAQSGLYVRAPRTHRSKACIRAGDRRGRMTSSAVVTSAGAPA
jgi:hypothetical protein